MFNRNPVHSKRPPFSKISTLLNTSRNILPQWSGEDYLSNVVPKASELGAPLTEAEVLYDDLQNTYFKNKS